MVLYFLRYYLLKKYNFYEDTVTFIISYFKLPYIQSTSINIFIITSKKYNPKSNSSYAAFELTIITISLFEGRHNMFITNDKSKHTSHVLTFDVH